MDRGAWWGTVHGVAESNSTKRLTVFFTCASTTGRRVLLTLRMVLGVILRVTGSGGFLFWKQMALTVWRDVTVGWGPASLGSSPPCLLGGPCLRRSCSAL